MCETTSNDKRYNYNEIDFVKFPLFNFSRKSQKDRIEVINGNDKWIVEYSKYGILNSFDYKIFMYLINKLFPFDSDKLTIRLIDIMKDLKLPTDKHHYERIFNTFLKFKSTLIITENTRYNKSNKKLVKKMHFNILASFMKTSDIDKENNRERDREYKLYFEPLLVKNLRHNYYLFHNHNFNYPASNQLLYYILYHRHSNKELKIGYSKILELLQLKERPRRALIKQQLDKYFDELIAVNEIRAYKLYKNPRTGNYIYKIYYAPSKKKSAQSKKTKTIEVKKLEKTNYPEYNSLSFKEILKIYRELRASKYYKYVIKWDDRQIQKNVIKGYVENYLKNAGSFD